MVTRARDETIAHYVAAFERYGYAHLKAAYTDTQISAFHHMRDQAVRDWCFAAGTSAAPEAVGDVIERFPRQGLDAISNPLALGLAEALMGPVVQLDSAVLAGSPSVAEQQRGQPVAWHRDRFGFFPLGVYTRPQAIVCIAYLQEMTDDIGPLRVVPGSHRDPIPVDLDRRQAPHTHEVMVHTKPGDIIALHHNLLHSGTHNATGGERRFLGFTYNTSSLRQQDNFAGPNCQALIATARRTNNRRILRLLGQDPLIDPRQNTGFVQPHTAYWPTWLHEDDRHAAEAADLHAQVDEARRGLR